MKPYEFAPDATFEQVQSGLKGCDYTESTTLGNPPSMDGPHQPAMMPTQALDAANKVTPGRDDDPNWKTEGESKV